MGVSSIIKSFLINEVGGISFEVRKWSEIIEKYVSDILKKEREKNTPTYDNSPYYSWGDKISHLENSFGQKVEKAYLYGYDLSTYADFYQPIEDYLFSVEIHNGEIYLDVVEGDESELGEDDFDNIWDILDEYRFDESGLLVDTDSNDVKVVYKDEETYNTTPRFSLPTINKIEIEGKDFPEAYENFKVDKWIINNSSRIEYDHWKSGYNEEGEYVVYLNMPIYSVGGSALVHEVKHSFDDWNRMSKGAQPIRSSWEVKNIYTPDFEKLVLGGSRNFGDALSDIIKSYYMGSKLETPAYLENEYDSPKVKTYRKVAKKMMNFKASDYLGKDGNFSKYLQRNWSNLIDEYDIPFFRKFKNVGDFLKYTEKHFNKRGRDILRRIDKMLYLHGKLDKK